VEQNDKALLTFRHKDHSGKDVTETYEARISWVQPGEKCDYFGFQPFDTAKHCMFGAAHHYKANPPRYGCIDVKILGKCVFALLLFFLPLTGCATSSPVKWVYRQDQFNSRLEYLRFCQHYELLTYRCPDLQEGL
jgi:hypothetical protein